MLIIACPASIFALDADRIFKIEIAGNERIDTGFVLNAVKSKENEAYNADKVKEDMKNIYKTGFFSDVQIDVKDTDKGKIVTFVVIERPPIKAIYISGNKKIKTSDLVEKLKIRTNTVLNTDRIKESIDELKKFYASKGYYATAINYEIDYGEEYNATVTITVDEPSQAHVKKIVFVGNKAFKPSVLKRYMRTKEKGLFSWITGSGILDEDNLEEDRKNVEAFYNDNGYVRANIGVPDIAVSKDGKSITITLGVQEGDIYKNGTIDFAGDLMFPKDELTGKLKSKTGNIFRSSLYHEDVLTLTDLYQDKGYAFCDVAPLNVIDDKTKTVNMVFNISKGTEVYFNRINIIGNAKTRDKVIRRELKFAEGDRFSSSSLKESKRKLTNTTYFKDIDMKLIKTEDPAKANMDISVEERPTGTLSVGVGYSTAENAFVTGTISQENLLGTGRNLSLEASLGSITHEFRISYLEPYIFDKNLHAGASAFNFTRIFDTYDYKRQGGSLSLTRPLTDFVKTTVQYRLENVDVYNVEDDASAYVQNQSGSSVTSAVSLTLARNTIDNVMNPTKGSHSAITVEYAGGPLLGDNKFVSVVGYAGKYFPVSFLDSAFFIKATAGTIRQYSGVSVPIFEKFFIGGLNSIRGFKYGEAGPTDTNGEVIGGINEAFCNLEWIFPIFKPAGLKGVIFFDAGDGFDTLDSFSLKTTGGFGIRWFSPMGPIRLELGFNLNPKEDERKNAFEFTIGTQY